MRRSLQILGPAGFILILFGSGAYLSSQDLRDPYVLSHLGLGSLFLLVFLATQGGSLLVAWRRRRALYRLRTALSILAAVAVLVLVNFLAALRPYRWDMTESGVFGLAPQSIQLLRILDRDLEIYGFFGKGENRQAEDLLRSYAYHSPRVRVHLIDPNRQPEIAKKFRVETLEALHIRYDNESITITELTEQAITSAISRLIRARKKTVYFLTGHREPGLDDKTEQGYAAAKEALESENLEVRDLSLSSLESVPPGTSLLVIAGPKTALLEHELVSIDAYARNGGSLLILLSSPEGESLSNFLKRWGVEVGNDIVLDQVIRLFSGPSLGVEPIAESYDPLHPITRRFQGRTLFPMVRSVDAASPAGEGFKIASLVKTSPTSWAERDLDSVFKQGKASLGPGDKKGPVSIGVAVTADLKKIGGEREGEAKIVVLGSAAFANNRFLSLLSNRDFFLSVARWLVGEESPISIRPRSIRASRIELTQTEGKVIFYVSFLALPEILLLAGLVVWWRRKS